MTVTLTPSNVLHLAQCKKRFHVLDINKEYPEVRAQQSSLLAFSTAVHYALAHVFDPSLGPPPNTKDLTTYIRMGFLREKFYNRDPNLREIDMHRAHRLICTYLEEEEEEDAAGTLAVEFSATCPIATPTRVLFNVSARLDRLIVRRSDPKTLRIRDWKVASSMRPLEPIQIFCNLAVAKLSHKGKYKKFVLELVNLTDSGAEVTEYEDRDVKGIAHHVAKMVRQYEEEQEHKACPSDHCQFCQLREQCHSIETASSLDEISFDDLDDEEEDQDE